MGFAKREGVLILTSAVSAIAVFDYYVKIPRVSFVAGYLNRFGVIMTAFFLGLGIVSLARLQIRHIRRRREKWWLSLYLIGLLIITVICGLLPPMNLHPSFKWIFERVYQPLHISIYSLVAFVLVSIAYRAFRLRTLESTLMGFFAIVAMLRNAPIGPALFPPIGWLGDWLLGTVSLGVNRGFTLVIAVGIISTGLRILLGRERGYLGAEGGGE